MLETWDCGGTVKTPDVLHFCLREACVGVGCQAMHGTPGTPCPIPHLGVWWQWWVGETLAQRQPPVMLATGTGWDQMFAPGLVLGRASWAGTEVEAMMVVAWCKSWHGLANRLVLGRMF